MTATLVRHFPTMGGKAAVHLESDSAGAARLEDLAAAIERLFGAVEATLSPYRPESELSALNADPRAAVPASALVADLVRAARRASAQTRGIVDATLPVQTRERPAVPADLADALRAAPPRRAARPALDWRSRQPSVDRDGRVCRTPGVTIDPGGLGKGLAADLAAALLPAGVHGAISCGGDLAVRGPARAVAVTGAHTGDEVHRLSVRGGVATSGIHARLWREDDGTYSHHVLDPATGCPAWTGLVAVTAVAPSALDAEILAKRALLTGPLVARRFLRVYGGVLQHDDGSVEIVESLPTARLAVAA
jgi:thiamine biosynthesis lipoprotein